MDRRLIGLAKVAIALLAGVSALLVVGGGVAAALEPYVWPSVLVGLPVGTTAGVVALVLVYLGLSFRTEQAVGEVSRDTAIRLRAAVAAAVAMAVAGVLAAGSFFLVDRTWGIRLLVAGPPIAAVLVGFLAARRLRRRGEPERPERG